MARADRPSSITSAELLAVGAELLVGETQDTNSGELAVALTDLGVEVRRMSQLPDDLDVVATSIRAALRRADLVVTTGGLGPTPDDLTREGIAAALDLEPFVDPALEAWLRDIWARRGLPFSDTNLKQAWLVDGGQALDNPHGTAPGWWIDAGEKVILALPGPPRELRPMWRDQALPRLQALGLGADRHAVTLHLTGIGESVLVDLIGREALTRTNPRMATYARTDSVDVRVSAAGAGGLTAHELVSEAVAGLSPRLDPYLFARDDEDWRAVLASRLGARRLATVEIGTGGHLGLLLGASDFLVAAEQLREADAPVAELASRMRARSSAEIGLAAIAGESGDDMAVEIAVDLDGRCHEATRSAFRGGDVGRRRCANAAVAELWRVLGD